MGELDDGFEAHHLPHSEDRGAEYCEGCRHCKTRTNYQGYCTQCAKEIIVGDGISEIYGSRNRDKPKSSLIHEWEVDPKHRYRLIAIADHTPGYEDEYLVELLGQDGLGEIKWSEVLRWRANSCELGFKILMGAIKSLMHK